MTKKMTTKQTRRTKTQKWLIAVGCLPVLGFLAILFFLFSPTQYPAGNGDYPLGDRLEYIGKQDYGCRFGCDSNPSSVLFYATDMTKDELKGYFRGAEYRRTNFTETNAYALIMLESNQHIKFTLTYNSQPPETTEIVRHRDSSKPHSVSIGFSDYQTAKDSL